MITADVSVRPALPSDLATIAQLQLAAWQGLLGAEAVSGLDPAAVEQQWEAALRDPDPRRRVLVALASATVVGFAALSPTQRSAEDERWSGEVIALEVDPSRRREGHGSRLLAAVADLAREAGAHHLGAWTMTHDPERRAFLEAAGFAEAGLRRRLELPDGQAVDEILLTASVESA